MGFLKFIYYKLWYFPLVGKFVKDFEMGRAKLLDVIIGFLFIL